MDYMNQFLTTVKIPPFPNYLSSHMSHEDFNFIFYWEWLEDEYFSESADNCEPPSDLLDPAKFQKYCDLKHIESTVCCAKFWGDYNTRPMENYCKPHMSEKDYRFFLYMDWLRQDYSLKRVHDVTSLPHVDLTDPIKTHKFQILKQVFSKATLEYMRSLPSSVL